MRVHEDDDGEDDDGEDDDDSEDGESEDLYIIGAVCGSQKW